MPAGMVLVVAVAALILAMFLSADAIHRKAEGRPNQAEWRKTMSKAVVGISDTFKVDAPSKAVDDAVGPLIGHERKTGDQSTDEILAEKRAAEGGDPTATATASTVPGQTTVPGQVATPPTTIDKTPKLRAPTPDNPLKVWVGGDSIAYDPGVAMSNFSAKTKLMTVTQDSRASTGLVRSDFFNWPQHLFRDVVPTAPDVMMIMYGGNDAQGIAAGPGVAYLYGSPEWQKEYRKRVGDTMDLLQSKDNNRLVIWMGMPPVAPTSSIKNMDMMNYIFFTEAQKRPWVKYFDSWPFFTGTDGAYSLSLTSADGSEHVMRAKDGVHFSQTGGERFGWAVYAKLSGLVDFGAAPPLVPDPKSAPPADIKERTDVPPAANQAG